MPSPFPGMNPFLEQPGVWHDFHTRFAVALADQLAQSVGPHYHVRVEEHVYLRELSAQDRLRYLEIIERSGRGIAAVIEILSPANKAPGPDHDSYLTKRLAILRSVAHFIELDLLRGGQRMPIEGLPPCDYYAAVSAVNDRPNGGIWPFQLRDPLPVVPVPLRGDDPPAQLDLKVALDRVYDAAMYEREIYFTPPTPALRPEDHVWAKEQLAKVGISLTMT